MFCKFCGNKIDNNSLFCSYCGTKQSEIHKPISIFDETLMQEDAKTLNVNLSFVRQTNTKSNNEIVKPYIEPKYDPNYVKETEATIIGSILLVSSLLLVIFQPFKFDTGDSYNQFRVISSTVAMVMRIFVTIWVVQIAKKQNRETFIWGLFAIFLPSIALIIIGLKKKMFAKLDIDNSLGNAQNSLILTEKADEFLNSNKDNECIRFAKKAIELDSNNKKAANILVKAKNKSSYVNKHFNEKVSYSDEELILDIKKRVMDCTEQNFKDLTFLRGIIVTLSLRDNCKLILDMYKRKYSEDLCDEIRLKCPERKSSNYILEPLIKKELTPASASF